MTGSAERACATHTSVLVPDGPLQGLAHGGERTLAVPPPLTRDWTSLAPCLSGQRHEDGASSSTNVDGASAVTLSPPPPFPRIPASPPFLSLSRARIRLYAGSCTN